MIETILRIQPEIALFITTCLVMVVGLSRSAEVRRLTPIVSAIGLVAALVLALVTTPEGHELARYAKTLTAIVGLMLLLVLPGTVDRDLEEQATINPSSFDPIRATQGEFYTFFLFSLTGLMLCASSTTLIWLFLALELTSLPTYVMVTVSTRKNRSMEAGVKYFFLGALGAAIFLYGFALLYGATGSVDLSEIHAALREQADGGGLSTLAIAAILLSLVGLCFKIAAFPMHFYTPDVYQGAAPGVSAMLAFVPKTAGFIAIILLLSAVGWDWGPAGSHGLPEPVSVTLWALAALTMTVGNVLALVQSSVKRMLAYSSIAHSGYMLVGVIAGPVGETFSTNGLAAVLFYLLTYGVMNLGAFAVLASLERVAPDGSIEEVDDIDDLRGLCAHKPALGWVMVLSAAGLMGLPPLLGFFGKIPLFTSGIEAGHIGLVIVLAINSAIAAFYYLRLISAPLLADRDDTTRDPIIPTPIASRRVAGLLSAGGVIVLLVFLSPLGSSATKAANDPLGLGTSQEVAQDDNDAPTQTEPSEDTLSSAD